MQFFLPHSVVSYEGKQLGWAYIKTTALRSDLTEVGPILTFLSTDTAVTVTVVSQSQCKCVILLNRLLVNSQLYADNHLNIREGTCVLHSSVNRVRRPVAARGCLPPGENVFVAAPSPSTPAIRSPNDILMVTTMALV